MANDPKVETGDVKTSEGNSDAQGKENLETVPLARLNEVVARAKRAEEKLTSLEQAQENERKSSLEKKQEFEKLYMTEKSTVEKLKPYETALQDYLKSELEGLTEEQKSLVPDLPDYAKLTWVKKAKTAGVFGKNGDSIPGTFNHAPAGNGGKWWLNLKGSDPKLADLSSAQYAEWKAHNKGTVSTRIQGGF